MFLVKRTGKITKRRTKPKSLWNYYVHRLSVSTAFFVALIASYGKRPFPDLLGKSFLFCKKLSFVCRKQETVLHICFGYEISKGGFHHAKIIIALVRRMDILPAPKDGTPSLQLPVPQLRMRLQAVFSSRGTGMSKVPIKACGLLRQK